MNSYTYRDLIRKYSADVASGAFDNDLLPRQRRLVHVLLNLASNAHFASVIYPPTQQTRQDVCKALGAIVWDARPLVDAATGRGSCDDFGVAVERAIVILRGL